MCVLPDSTPKKLKKGGWKDHVVGIRERLPNQTLDLPPIPPPPSPLPVFGLRIPRDPIGVSDLKIPRR